MKIAITGHRPNKLGNDYELTSGLMVAIRARIIEALMLNCINPKELTLITGMALGIDTMFAEIAIGLSIPFIAAIPCLNQAGMWTPQSVQRYLAILGHPLCTKHLTSLTGYTHICMQIRNEWMVNNCDILIAVWDGTSGGTANCVRYAEKVERKIIRINPKEIV